MPFAGTEGYSPAAYIPYIVGAILAEVSGLDFPATLLTMRILGVLAFTAAVGFAIRVTPALKWAFVLIAMLPVALYNRSVLSADGAALASALVVTALCFTGINRFRPAWERSLWMMLCSLAKQPQIVFLLLEGLVGGKARRHGRSRRSGTLFRDCAAGDRDFHSRGDQPVPTASGARRGGSCRLGPVRHCQLPGLAGGTLAGALTQRLLGRRLSGRAHAQIQRDPLRSELPIVPSLECAV
jgi:Predicted membrane protein (DUF2142)